jgi:hypothetical protein
MLSVSNRLITRRPRPSFLLRAGCNERWKLSARRGSHAELSCLYRNGAGRSGGFCKSCALATVLRPGSGRRFRRCQFPTTVLYKVPSQEGEPCHLTIRLKARWRMCHGRLYAQASSIHTLQPTISAKRTSGRPAPRGGSLPKHSSIGPKRHSSSRFHTTQALISNQFPPTPTSGRCSIDRKFRLTTSLLYPNVRPLH